MTSATSRLSRVSTAIALSFALAAPALAAGYIKFDGVDGEVAGSGRGGEIHIESFSWGASQAGTGRGMGKMHQEDISAKADESRKVEKSSPSLSEIVVSKSTDSTSPASGAHGTGGGGGAGKVSVHDISVTKHMDKSTAAKPAGGKDGAKGGNVEFEWKVEEGESAPPRPGSGGVLTAVVPAGRCKVGARYPGGEFGTGGKVYRLANVVVTACSPGRSAAGIPTETLSLNFDKITWK